MFSRLRDAAVPLVSRNSGCWSKNIRRPLSSDATSAAPHDLLPVAHVGGVGTAARDRNRVLVARPQRRAPVLAAGRDLPRGAVPAVVPADQEVLVVDTQVDLAVSVAVVAAVPEADAPAAACSVREVEPQLLRRRAVDDVELAPVVGEADELPGDGLAPHPVPAEHRDAEGRPAAHPGAARSAVAPDPVEVL